MAKITHCMIEARSGDTGALYSIWMPDTTETELRKIARTRFYNRLNARRLSVRRIATRIVHLNPNVKVAKPETSIRTIRTWE